MWLIKSSIGRKFVMAITGICLVLFVTFHVLMNSVALIWPVAYNSICEFLGANWYALIASAGLGLLFVLHICYAVWLTLQNRAARGTDRYAVTARQPQVEWSSKNMLVLGIVILAFLAVHLIQFWAKMQWNELRHAELSVLPQLNGAPVGPAQGTLMLQLAFSCWWTPVIYIIGFIALWFHMNHGFWSMFQTIGWNNKIWLQRLKTISCWWTSIVVLLFIAQAIVFTVAAHRNYYTDNEQLQEQYAEYWEGLAQKECEDFLAPIAAFQAEIQQAQAEGMDVGKLQAVYQNVQANIQNYVMSEGPAFLQVAEAIMNGYDTQCPLVMPDQTSPMNQLRALTAQVKQSLPESAPEAAAQEAAAPAQKAAPADSEVAVEEAVVEPVAADSADNNANNNN